MAEGGKATKGWVTAGCGLLLTLSCAASACFWLVLVIQDSGAIDGEEALPGLLGSCCCASISFLIAAGGIFWAIKLKKQADAPPA